MSSDFGLWHGKKKKKITVRGRKKNVNRIKSTKLLSIRERQNIRFIGSETINNSRVDLFVV